MGPRTERRHEQGEESRRRILDATIEIASERGYEATTISLVSKRSGLPVSSIYWHFGNKDELIAAVIQRSFDEWFADFPDEDDELAVEGTTREKLIAVVRREAVRLAEHPDFLRFGLMLTLEQRDDEPKARTLFLETREQALERIRSGFRRYFAYCGIEADDAYVSRIATLTMAAVDGVFVAKQATPGLDITPILDLLATAIDLLTQEHAPQR